MTLVPPLNALRAFESLGRNGSMAAAGRELNVSASAVSRLVKVLEQHLSTTLVERSANRLELTPHGQSYWKEINAGFEQIRTATARLRADQDNSILIGAGPTFAMRWLIPRLPRFQEKHPGIDVRLSTSVQEANPMLDDWSAAIRVGDGKWKGFEAEFLFAAELFPVCAPAIAKRLKRPSDLQNVPMILVTNSPEDWNDWMAAANLEVTAAKRVVRVDYPAFALQAAIDGAGVAIARAPFVVDDLAAGRLVKPFAMSIPKGKGWYFVTRPQQQKHKSLSAFRRWIKAEARRSPP